jgi:hypothetical protein
VLCSNEHAAASCTQLLFLLPSSAAKLLNTPGTAAMALLHVAVATRFLQAVASTAAAV